MIEPGSLICVKKKNFLIQAVQRRALLDIGEDPKYAEYTHVGVATKYGLGEMWPPKARIRPWKKVSGEILIRRPLATTLNQVADACIADVLTEEKYGYLDLLAYYLKWWWKLDSRFVDMFDDDDHDICSTRVIEWYRQAGIWTKPIYIKWSYYPARLACCNLWEDVRTIALP